MDLRCFEIAGPVLARPTSHSDRRGWLAEVFRRDDYLALGFSIDVVQENIVFSRTAGVVRGLHFQIPPQAQGKLVRVCRGAILDVMVDLRRASPSYGRHLAVEMRPDLSQLWIPPGFAHGYCTLQDDTEVVYKASAKYAPDCERAIAWDDPDLAISWPVPNSEAILSDRDRAHPRLRDLPVFFP